MYFRVELTHRIGVRIQPDHRRREDWLFGRLGLAQVGKSQRKVRALELIAPRVNGSVPYACLYKPEFLSISSRSISFSGLERTSVHDQTAWVQQCWLCVYSSDTEYMHWIRSLSEVPEWAVLLDR